MKSILKHSLIKSLIGLTLVFAPLSGAKAESFASYAIRSIEELDVGVFTSATLNAGASVGSGFEVLKINDQLAAFCSANVGITTDVSVSGLGGYVKPINCSNVSAYKGYFLEFAISLAVPVLNNVGVDAGGDVAVALGIKSDFFNELGEIQSSRSGLRQDLLRYIHDHSVDWQRALFIGNSQLAIQTVLIKAIERSVVCALANNKSEICNRTLSKSVRSTVKEISMPNYLNGMGKMINDLFAEFAIDDRYPFLAAFAGLIKRNIGSCHSISAGVGLGLTLNPIPVAGSLLLKNYRLLDSFSYSDLAKRPQDLSLNHPLRSTLSVLR